MRRKEMKGKERTRKERKMKGDEKIGKERRQKEFSVI